MFFRNGNTLLTNKIKDWFDSHEKNLRSTLELG